MNEPAEANGNRTSNAGFVWTLILGYGLAAFLLAFLIHWGGVWHWLANTRILRWLFDAGIVALTDADQGLIQGIPIADHYRGAFDPVAWFIVIVAVLCFVAYLVLKVIQFHFIARLCGSQGSLGQHTRAQLYGEGVGRLLPFNFGSVSLVTTLVGQGMSPVRARYAVYLMDLFAVFEIAFFAGVTLILLGIATWINGLVWALVILGASYFIVRRSRPSSGGMRVTFQGFWETVKYFSTQPVLALVFCLISVFAFFLLEVAAYFIASAYTANYVILHVGHETLMLALVAGSIAQLIRITPGGMGQFEWGMATALYLSGTGAPESMTIPLLYQMYRIGVSVVAVSAIGLVFGVETSFRRALDVFRGGPLQAAPPPPQAAGATAGS